GDVHSVAVDIATSMNDVTNVNANLEFDPSLSRYIVIALGQRTLDFDGALGRFQGTPEFDEESVADGFDLGAIEARKDFAEHPAQLPVAARQTPCRLPTLR